MLALPARVSTAAVRSSQQIKSAAERTSRRRRAFCDSLHERGGTGIKSGGSLRDCRSHRLNLVRHQLAVALRFGVSQCALG
jgi:hypothetical protein